MRPGTVTKALFSCAAAALALILATASPALAADGWQRSTPDSTWDNGHYKKCIYYYSNYITTDAGACFQPYGEWFWLKDVDEDGKPVAVDWKSTNGRAGTIYFDGGKAYGWTSLNKSFDEDVLISFRVCEAKITATSKSLVGCTSPWDTISAGLE